MLDATFPMRKYQRYLEALIWNLIFYSVESQNTAVANSATHGRAVSIDNNVSYITHCFIPRTTESLRKQELRSNLPTSELSGQKLLWHSCFPSDMFSPLPQACLCQYSLSSLLGEVKENGWHMRSKPRSWVLFCGVKWPLCSFLITDITLCYSRSTTTSHLPVAFHQHSAYILPLPNPQLKV